jgi:hypothetical protein
MGFRGSFSFPPQTGSADIFPLFSPIERTFPLREIGIQPEGTPPGSLGPKKDQLAPPIVSGDNQ